MPGSRTAVNISGLAPDQINRGEVLIRPGQYEPTRRVDGRLRLLADASGPLLHNREVKVFLGASETTATLRLLGTEELQPGQEGWIQLELNNPLVCVRGDPFIIRKPSPAETLGGGAIADPHPLNRHKRFEPEVLASLDALAQGAPTDVLMEAALALGAAPLRDMVARSHLEREAAQSAATQLVEEGRLVILERGRPAVEADLLAMPAPAWDALHDRARHLVSGYHAKYPLRPGIPREELKSRLEVPPRLFNAAVQRLIADGSLRDSGSALALAAHEVRFDPQQRAAVAKLMRQFEENPYGPPTLKECQALVGDEILAALISSGSLVAVSAEVVFRKVDYDSMVARIRDLLSEKGEITLAEVRDQFHTSRKFAQGLLEHLDATGVTRRSGDVRRLSR